MHEDNGLHLSALSMLDRKPHCHHVHLRKFERMEMATIECPRESHDPKRGSWPSALRMRQRQTWQFGASLTSDLIPP